MSHGDLAQMIGSVRQTFTAILKSLEGDAWIAWTHGGNECLQPDRLAEYLKTWIVGWSTDIKLPDRRECRLRNRFSGDRVCGSAARGQLGERQFR